MVSKEPKGLQHHGRLSLQYPLVLLILFLMYGRIGLELDGEDGQDHAQIVPAAVSDIDVVAVTEDWIDGQNVDGCEAISLHDVSTGLTIERGRTRLSPGRLAGRPDLSMFAATSTNQCGQGQHDTFNRDCKPWLTLAQLSSDGRRTFRDGAAVAIDVATMGGLTFLSDGKLLVATAKPGRGRSAAVIRPGPPFGIGRFDLPDVVPSSGQLGRAEQTLTISNLAFDILPVDNSQRALVATIDGTVIVLDPATMSTIGAPIPFPNAESPSSAQYNTRPAVNGMHATAAADGSIVFVNRMMAGDLARVDVNARTASIVPVAPDVKYTGGVALNNGWINIGLLAVHTEDHVIVLELTPDGGVSEVGRTAIRPPSIALGEFLGQAIFGPRGAIAWNTSGSHIIAATSRGTADFVVIAVRDEGRTLELVHYLTACPLSQNVPNDIWTANGLITPTPIPTPTTPPTATDEPTATPSPTALASATPSPSPTFTQSPTTTATSPPTPTPTPGPIYLPLALTERCDPTQQRIDVAMVIDASTSMGELTRAGRPKIAAALSAANAFLDLLQLDPHGDQAAIVTFNSDAWILAPLTSDRSDLDAALNAVSLGQQTRLDRAVAVGAQALAHGTRRRPGNEPVLVLLTDGRANPVPIEAAVAEADLTKAAGVTLFTIGLGEDIDAESLAAMASMESGFLRAPDAEDLAAVYAQVARSIPCPASAWWGGK